MPRHGQPATQPAANATTCSETENMIHFLAMKKQGSLASKLQAEKPWAKLRISRKQYMSSKPWKGADMSRQEFEKTLHLAPDDVIDELWDEAHADLLLDSMGLNDQ